MYHLGFSKQDIKEMTDEEWAENIAILENIRKEQAKQQPFGK
jgi:hypothetical protein